MLVSKSNGFNASAVLGSGSYNENKSSKHMELLAHSILKLICNANILYTIFCFLSSFLSKFNFF